MKRYLSGDHRALARLISIIENEENNSSQLLDSIYHRTGRAFRIGITGPPGAGKSTIVDQLARLYRKDNKNVGIIAVDPTSPFTGGALLGDRVRMIDLSSDSGVFIRSMATRGSQGGVAKHSQEVADLLDGFGMDIIIFETVGVGQSELDIVEAADSTVVVLVPESGDAIQAMKAGLMEIADIFVVNKSDRENAERTLLEIKQTLEIKDNQSQWKPLIISTVATTNDGIIKLRDCLNAFFSYQKKNNLRVEKQKKRLESYIREMVSNKILKNFWKPEKEQELKRQIEKIIIKKYSPYTVSERFIERFKKKK